MPDAVSSSLGIVAYLALFVAIGLVFLLVNLLVGKLVRPSDPQEEKLEIYECGEPAVGSSFVQFDLRFYVVALLFIIFDVEVAFFFPWATVFGKANHLAASSPHNLVVAERNGVPELTDSAAGMYRELGVYHPEAPLDVPPSLALQVDRGLAPAERSAEVVRRGSRQLALVTLVDIAIFFAVLLIGFAYVWKRGDLDWVRAYSRERAVEGDRGGAAEELDLEQALSA